MKENNNIMNVINFSTNWNNKLSCGIFTTIRLHNPEKYKLFEVYEITLRDKPFGRACIRNIRQLRYQQFSDFIFGLDMGLSFDLAMKVLLSMYGSDFADFSYDYVLLQMLERYPQLHQLEIGL